jgi:hypothetical protein
MTLRLTLFAATLALSGCGALFPQAPAPSFEATVAALTPEMLGATQGALLVVQNGPGGGIGGMAERARNGATVTLASADDSTLSLREGVMVATRGLATDLMAASVPSAAQLARGAGSHGRVHRYLDGAGDLVEVRFDCTLSAAGGEAVPLPGGRTVAARVVDERCAATNLTLSNRYWFDGRGKIRQSVQEIAGGAPPLRILHLRD